MSSAYQIIRDRIRTTLKSSQLAMIAGVQFEDWSADNGHVFIGSGGFVGAKNRGRCPFVEVIGDHIGFTREWNNANGGGGTMTSDWTIRLHIASRSEEDAQTFGHEFLSEALAEIRSTHEDIYNLLGDDAISTVEKGPFGFQMDATLNLEHSFSRLDYESDE